MKTMDVIKKVWECTEKGTDPELWDGITYHDEIIFHVRPHYNLLLELEDGAIIIGVDGVTRLSDISDVYGCELEEEQDIANVIFPGEQIIEITEDRILLSHVTIKIRPDEQECEHQIDVPFIGFAHILRPCICGGKAEFMMNRRGDYYVRCQRCGRESIDGYIPTRIIDDWNSGEERGDH